MAEKTVAEKTEKAGKIYTVGPTVQHIQHRADRVNYWPGQTFKLDHLSADTVESFLERGLVVDVTGKTAKQIGEIVGKYPGFSAVQVLAAMRRAAEDD
jgi:hypothetical protein